HRSERLQACSAIGSRPTAGGGRPTGGPAILLCRALGDWLSLRAEPVSWRRYPNHGPNSERRRYLTRLGGECEIVLRTCFVCRWIYEANRRPRLAALPENRPRRNQVAPVCRPNFSRYRRDRGPRDAWHQAMARPKGRCKQAKLAGEPTSVTPWSQSHAGAW